MSRRIRMHAIEVLARDYIKFLKKTNNLRKERHFVDKAAKMIGVVLDSPCCDENNAVTFSTPKKNQWIHSLKALLLKVDVKKWRESLERAKLVLTNAISNPCCVLPPITFTVVNNTQNNSGVAASIIVCDTPLTVSFGTVTLTGWVDFSEVLEDLVVLLNLENPSLGIWSVNGSDIILSNHSIQSCEGVNTVEIFND